MSKSNVRLIVAVFTLAAQTPGSVAANADRDRTLLPVTMPTNTTSTLALMAGAFPAACAVFIIERDFSFAGIVRVPSEPLIKMLVHLAKGTS